MNAPHFNKFQDFLASLSSAELAKHPIFVFHHDDMDGAFAAASALRAFVVPDQSMRGDVREFSKNLSENMVFVKINYDRQADKSIVDEVPAGASVFVLDFAFNKEVTQALIKHAGFFLTLDHHHSNELMLGNTEHTYFDMLSSGALMSFKYFQSNWVGEPPLAITLADNRDLWQKDLGTEDPFHEFMMYLRSELNNNQRFIHELVPFLDSDQKTQAAVDQGAPFVAKRDSNIKSATSKKRLIHTTMGGYPTVLFNYCVDQSDACEFLYLQEQYTDHIVGAFSFLNNGMVNFSLRKGKDCDADLSLIAEINYKGGGHKQAAGFHVTYEDAVDILNSKEKWAMCWMATEVDAILNTGYPEISKKSLMKLKPLMVSRKVCEKNTRFLQVLPYIYVVNPWTKEVFSYNRPKSSSEQRLHGSLSIGLGGHVDTLPTGSCMAVHLADEAARELNEEVGIESNSMLVMELYRNFQQGNFDIVRIRDTEVESVHLGLVIGIERLIDFTNMQISEIINPKWNKVSDLKQKLALEPNSIEAWSRATIAKLPAN